MGLVAVFAKPPVAGRSKTRLGAVVGHDRAAAMARALLQDSVDRWAAFGHDVVVATTDPDADHGLHRAVDLHPQGGGSLGQRIERVLRYGVARHGWAMAVGADAPAVPSAAIQAALGGLEGGATVLGPTVDGGFWALGMHACPEGLLEGLPWSDPTTHAATRARLVERGFPPLDLPGAWDVDHAEDLRRLVDAASLAPRSSALARAWLGEGWS